MSTLLVDFGQRFIRAAGAGVDCARLLRDSRRRQEFVRPPEIVWAREFPHLFWAAQDLAETMPVEERIAWRGIPLAVRSERVIPATLLALAITRLAAEYRSEFSVAVTTLAVALPWGAAKAEVEILEQACAVAEIGRLRVAHPAVCAAWAAGRRDEGHDLVIDVGAGGVRVAWVRWQRGRAELGREWIERSFDDAAVLAAAQALLGAPGAPAGLVRALADRAWRVRPSGQEPRLIRSGDGLLPVLLSQRAADALMSPLDQMLARICEQAVADAPAGAYAAPIRVVCAGGVSERALRWADTQAQLRDWPKSNPGATATVFGLGATLGQETEPAGQPCGELGIEVPLTSRSERSRSSRSGLGIDSVPLIPAGSNPPASGRLGDSECGRLGSVVRLYQQSGEMRWSYAMDLPEGFVASIQPWLEISLVGGCGGALLVDARTHLGDTPRRMLLHRESLWNIDARMGRWMRSLQLA